MTERKLIDFDIFQKLLFEPHADCDDCAHVDTCYCHDAAHKDCPIWADLETAYDNSHHLTKKNTMTLDDFLKDFVTAGRVSRNTWYHPDGHKIKHAMLKNGWLIPVRMLTALRKAHYPPKTEIVVLNPQLDSSPALLIFHPKGRLSINLTTVSPT